MVTATRPKVKILFEPVNKQQDDFVASGASRCLFSGAFGAGKSIALCTKGLKLSLDYPKNFGLICRKVRATLQQTTIKTFFDRVCPRELVADYNKSEGLVTLTNGSQILFGGLDDPLKLGSLELGWAGIDEAIETTEDDWKMLEGRLRLLNVPHQIFAATNPGPPSHYLYDMFFKQMRGDAYQAASLENPELPEDYKKRLNEFEGVYRDRYVLGLWKGLEGLVYSSFDDKVCLIPRFEVPKSWLVYSGHDFGDANPAAVFYAESSGTGDFYAFAEYFPGPGRSIYDHVQEFKRITHNTEADQKAGLAHNVIKRAGGNHTTEGEIRQGYTAQGWHIQEPKYSKEPRYQIQKVQGLHRLNKIYVFNDLTNYLREKLSFIYEKKDGVLTEKIHNEADFHLMCLIAGTMIKTNEGEKPIETIKRGDMVLTREGYRRVEISGVTGLNKDTLTASFSDGTNLTGTAEHHVYVRDRGFIPLTALRYNDIMETWKEKQLSTTEQNTTGIRKPSEEATEFTLGRLRDTSIVLCGKMPMVKYLRDVPFTIKMMTLRIMNCLTSSAKVMVAICQTIWWDTYTTLNTLLGYSPSVLLAGSNGRQQMGGGQILLSGQSVCGERKSRSLRPALIVGLNIRQSNHPIANSVQGDANQRIGTELEKTEKYGYVQFAGDNTNAENTQGIKLVLADVVWCLGVKPSGKATVYDLSVNAVHEYFANGILVHNSAERGILSDFAPETVDAGSNIIKAIRTRG